MNDLSDKTTIVIGASRGLGRGIATAIAQTGAPVVAVARTRSALDELANLKGIRRRRPMPAIPPPPRT